MFASTTFEIVIIELSLITLLHTSSTLNAGAKRISATVGDAPRKTEGGDMRQRFEAAFTLVLFLVGAFLVKSALEMQPDSIKPDSGFRINSVGKKTDSGTGFSNS